MAAGDTLLILNPLNAEPPHVSGATFDVRNGRPVLDFDSSTKENAFFSTVLPRNYSGSGLTINIAWSATSATTGYTVWKTAIERNKDDDLDIDLDSFGPESYASGLANATNGKLTYSPSVHTDGSQMDGVLAGEMFRLKIAREPSHATDTMSGDAELVSIELRET